MTREAILEKAIQKAIDGGFDVGELEWSRSTPVADIAEYYTSLASIKEDCFELIYSHLFAKSLWGESDDDRKTVLEETDWRKWPFKWQWHLPRSHRLSRRTPR